MNVSIMLLIIAVAVSEARQFNTRRLCNTTFCSKCAKLIGSGGNGKMAYFCGVVIRAEQCCGKFHHPHM